MSKILLLGKLLLFIFLIGVVLYVIKYAQDLRDVFSDRANKSVAGAKTGLESEIKKDVVKYLNSGKEQVFNLSVKDVYEHLSKLGKISKDFKGTIEEVEIILKDLVENKNETGLLKK